MVSMSRGNHWIIEDCVMRQTNSVALDIGMQGGGKVSPAVIGYAIVRRNHIDDVGVCGLAGLAVQNTLIESTLIEHVGWQDAEMTWEAGAIKLHVSRNCLLRNNVIRHLDHAMAIWLDYLNVNTRITGNVIGDTLECAAASTLRRRIIPICSTITSSGRRLRATASPLPITPPTAGGASPWTALTRRSSPIT